LSRLIRDLGKSRNCLKGLKEMSKMKVREIISRIDKKALRLAREWLDESEIVESNGQLKAVARCYDGNFGRFTLAISIEDLMEAEEDVKGINSFLTSIQDPEGEYWKTKTMEMGALAKNLSANDPIKNIPSEGNRGSWPLDEKWVNL